MYTDITEHLQRAGHSPVKTSLGLRSIWELHPHLLIQADTLFTVTWLVPLVGCWVGEVEGGYALHHVGSSVAGRRPSSCLMLAPERVASVVVAHGLSCPWHVGSFQIRDWTHVLCTGRRVLSHWITRKVPTTLVLHPAQWLLVISPKYQD